MNPYNSSTSSVLKQIDATGKKEIKADILKKDKDPLLEFLKLPMNYSIKHDSVTPAQSEPAQEETKIRYGI